MISSLHKSRLLQLLFRNGRIMINMKLSWEPYASLGSLFLWRLRRSNYTIEPLQPFGDNHFKKTTCFISQISSLSDYILVFAYLILTLICKRNCSVLTYLWGLLLTNPLISKLVSLHTKPKQVNETLENYPIPTPSNPSICQSVCQVYLYVKCIFQKLFFNNKEIFVFRSGSKFNDMTHNQK